MNYTDTNKIRNLLLSTGMEEVEDEKISDLLILNTCSVRQRAEDKVSGVGRKVLKIKENNSDFMVVMTGCMSQRINREFNIVKKGYREHLQNQFSWVDYFVEIGDLKKLVEIVGADMEDVDYFKSSQSENSHIIGYLPISIGCDNFCSYCIVPYTRGREISISLDIIERKFDEMVNAGYKLIYLIGQNVNSWESEEMKFPELLDRLAKKNDSIWLTYLSSHPKDFGKDLIDTMAQNPSICPYLNLAVQSGSDVILKAMNRKYTADEYIEKIDLLRERLPDVRLSTDLIVGFPDESSSDFDNSLKLIDRAKFAMAYISEYSPREGSVACNLNDDVSRKVKKDRKKRADELIIKNSLEFNQKKVGKEIKILITRDNFGVTQDLTEITFEGDTVVGEFANVKVSEASECGLIGTLGST